MEHPGDAGPDELGKHRLLMDNDLTYDDVAIEQGFTKFLFSEIDTSSRLSDRHTLQIPIISAGMDTITNSKVAEAVANEGGLGALHPNWKSVAEYQNQVAYVKRRTGRVITSPFTLKPDDPVSSMSSYEDNFGIQDFPVVDPDGKVHGIIRSGTDCYSKAEGEKKVIDRMLPLDLYASHGGLLTVPSEVSPADITRAEESLKDGHVKTLLLMREDGSLYGLMTRADTRKRVRFPNANLDSHGRLKVGAYLTTSMPNILEVAEVLINEGADPLFLEAADGAKMVYVEAAGKLLDAYRDRVDIVVGNFGNPKAFAEFLRQLHARFGNLNPSSAKVGISIGGTCTSYLVSGVAGPQISATYQIAQICNPLGISVITDGGVEYSGDITKALSAGASAVMIGTLLGGVDEGPGEFVSDPRTGAKSKIIRGMGSASAMKSGAHLRDYSSDRTPEGVEGYVAARGSIYKWLETIMGGVKAGMEKSGCRTIPELWSRSNMYRVSLAGMQELPPHGLTSYTRDF